MKQIYLLLFCCLTFTLPALAQSTAITASIPGQTCSCKTSPQSSLQANGLNQEYREAVTVDKVDINHDFLLHSEGDVNNIATNNAANNEPIGGNESLVDTDGDGVQDASDCAPADPTRWRVVNVYPDQDGDGYTLSNPIPLCIGANAPAGFSLTQSANTDCIDTDASIWRWMEVYVDGDGDGYTVGSVQTCIGTNPPAGYTLTQKGNDCNDKDASVWQGRVR